MTAPTLYEIETSEGDDGTMHPAEQLWMPGEDAVENGFIAHGDLHVTGLDDPTDDHRDPVAFLVLGQQKWAGVIEAGAAHMSRVHGWRSLHLYPGDDPSVSIPRIPRAVLTWGVFLQHPHPCALSVSDQLQKRCFGAGPESSLFRRAVNRLKDAPCRLCAVHGRRGSARRTPALATTHVEYQNGLMSPPYLAADVSQA